MKQYARKCTGAENVNTLDNEIFNEMQVAHSNHINKKKKKKQKDCWMSEEKGRAIRKRTKTRKNDRNQSNKMRKPKVILTKEKKMRKTLKNNFYLHKGCYHMLETVSAQL